MYTVPPPYIAPKEEPKVEVYKSLHRWWYCGKKFRVNGKEYLYLRADYEFYENSAAPVSVIKFTDGKQRYTMLDEAFFAKEKRFYDEKNNRY